MEEIVTGILLLIPFGILVGWMTARVCTKLKVSFVRSDIWTTVVVFVIGDLLMEWLLPSLSCLPDIMSEDQYGTNETTAASAAAVAAALSSSSPSRDDNNNNDFFRLLSKSITNNGNNNNDEFDANGTPLHYRHDEYHYTLTWLLQNYGFYCGAREDDVRADRAHVATGRIGTTAATYLLTPDATAFLFTVRLVFLCVGVYVGESLGSFVAITGGIATGKSTVAKMFLAHPASSYEIYDDSDSEQDSENDENEDENDNYNDKDYHHRNHARKGSSNNNHNMKSRNRNNTNNKNNSKRTNNNNSGSKRSSNNNSHMKSKKGGGDKNKKDYIFDINDEFKIAIDAIIENLGGNYLPTFVITLINEILHSAWFRWIYSQIYPLNSTSGFHGDETSDTFCSSNEGTVQLIDADTIAHNILLPPGILAERYKKYEDEDVDANDNNDNDNEGDDDDDAESVDEAKTSYLGDDEDDDIRVYHEHVNGIHPTDSVYYQILDAFDGEDILQSSSSNDSSKSDNDDVNDDDNDDNNNTNDSDTNDDTSNHLTTHPPEIDRLKLGAIIFKDRSERKKLNSITHPKILSLLLRKISSSVFFSDADITIGDLPLLFESGRLSWLFGITVCVAVRDPAVQLKRLQKRNKELSKDECQQRIESQMPLPVKVNMADIVIYNDGDLHELRSQVEAVRRDMMGRLYGIGMTLLQMLLLIGGSTSIAVSSKFYNHWQQ